MTDSQPRTVRVLSGRDVRRALPMAEAIAAMRMAFGELERGGVQMPARAHIEVDGGDGTALFMPSYAPCFGNLGIKIVNLFAGNAARGLPRIQALVCLFDGRTGTPTAILDGASLTALRTGAASGLATDLLARSEASTVAVFGAGVQARTQLEAVRTVRAVRAVRVYDPVAKAARTFAQETRGQLGLDVEVAACPRAALAGAEIVCTATVSATPVFEDADVAPGTHINAIGSYKPEVQEIPAQTVRRAQVVVDHLESALAEAGDLIIPLRDGLITRADLQAELGALVIGRLAGRTRDDAVTLFKSVGVAVQDLAAASAILVRAEAEDLGTLVPL